MRPADFVYQWGMFQRPTYHCGIPVIKNSSFFRETEKGTNLPILHQSVKHYEEFPGGDVTAIQRYCIFQVPPKDARSPGLKGTDNDFPNMLFFGRSFNQTQRFDNGVALLQLKPFPFLKLESFTYKHTQHWKVIWLGQKMSFRGHRPQLVEQGWRVFDSCCRHLSGMFLSVGPLAWSRLCYQVSQIGQENCQATGVVTSAEFPEQFVTKNWIDCLLHFMFHKLETK